MSFSILCVFIHFCQINWLFAEIIILSTIDKMTRRLCYCLSSRRLFKHNKTTADPGRAPFFFINQLRVSPFFPKSQHYKGAAAKHGDRQRDER